MNFEQIRPFARYAVTLKPTQSANAETMVAYDNCIIYTLSGFGNVCVENKLYNMSAGSVLTWRAGTPYKIYSEGDDAVYIKINFDYTDEKRIINSFRIPAESPGIFNHGIITDTTRFDDHTEFNGVIHKTGMRHAEEMFVSLMSEFKNPKQHRDIRISARLTLILSELTEKTNTTYSSAHTDKTAEIVEYIHEHYTQNMTNEQIAKIFNFHPQHLNKLIRNKTGYPLHKYIIMRRISKAVDLLETTKMPIYEIAEEVGFQDLCHFSRYFKDYMGSSPRMYRKINRSLKP